MPVSVEVTSPATESESNHSEDEESIGMIEAAQKMISEDARKEFFAVRNLDEAEVYFSRLVDIITFLLKRSCRPLNPKKMTPSLVVVMVELLFEFDPASAHWSQISCVAFVDLTS